MSNEAKLNSMDMLGALKVRGERCADVLLGDLAPLIKAGMEYIPLNEKSLRNFITAAFAAGAKEALDLIIEDLDKGRA